MSKDLLCDVEMNDFPALKAALKDVGVDAKAITETEGRLTVSRSIGLTKDITFTKNSQGKVEMSMYDMDVRRLGGKIAPKSQGGTGELLQHYAKNRIIQHAQKKYGHKIKSCETKDGKIRIRIGIG